jgi:hypothetical protein
MASRLGAAFAISNLGEKSDVAVKAHRCHAPGRPCPVAGLGTPDKPAAAVLAQLWPEPSGVIAPGFLECGKTSSAH